MLLLTYFSGCLLARQKMLGLSPWATGQACSVSGNPPPHTPWKAGMYPHTKPRLAWPQVPCQGPVTRPLLGLGTGVRLSCRVRGGASRSRVRKQRDPGASHLFRTRPWPPSSQ